MLHPRLVGGTGQSARQDVLGGRGEGDRATSDEAPVPATAEAIAQSAREASHGGRIGSTGSVAGGARLESAPDVLNPFMSTRPPRLFPGPQRSLGSPHTSIRPSWRSSRPVGGKWG